MSWVVGGRKIWLLAWRMIRVWAGNCFKWMEVRKGKAGNNCQDCKAKREEWKGRKIEAASACISEC
jgi:hypothetical protein